MAGASAAAPTASIEARIEAAARGELRTRIEQAGLGNATLQVEVRTQPGKPARTCRREVEVEAIDTHYVTRMRFAAVCTDEPGWRVEYVVRGSVQADVVVSAADIPAGLPIGADQLEIARRDASGTPGCLSSVEAVAGKASQRPVHRGQLIDKRWLVEPILVKRGASVNIVARNVGVEVQVPAEAMDEGRHNDIVRVRNTLNGQIIRARVIGENAVEPAEPPSP
jgi:flagella basal body P-ring formation protein FlgA